MTARPRGGVPLEVTKRHMRMAHAVLARRGFYPFTTPDYDDHVGACLLGLAKASKRYDESRGQTFEAYAYQRMLGEHGDYLRTLDHLTRTERAKVKAGELEDLGPRVAPVAYVPEGMDPVNAYERIALVSALDHAAESLTSNEALVVHLCGLRDWTHKDVSEFLGVSQSRVSQLSSAGRKKMRARLEPVLRDAA